MNSPDYTRGYDEGHRSGWLQGANWLAEALRSEGIGAPTAVAKHMMLTLLNEVQADAAANAVRFD
jgi:hypothetical protein